MSARRWKQTVRLLVLTASGYVRRQQQMYERYLLAWPPEPLPLHWVRRGDHWFLHGDVVGEPRPHNGASC